MLSDWRAATPIPLCSIPCPLWKQLEQAFPHDKYSCAAANVCTQEAQQRREWAPLMVYEEKVLPEQVRVGIMGLGEMAREPARMLSAIGYTVTGWTRRKARQVLEFAAHILL